MQMYTLFQKCTRVFVIFIIFFLEIYATPLAAIAI